MSMHDLQGAPQANLLVSEQLPYQQGGQSRISVPLSSGA